MRRPVGSIACVIAVLALSGAVRCSTAALPKVKAHWVKVESSHFTFYSNAGENATKHYAMNLERLRDVLGRILHGARFSSPVPGWIFVFRSEKSFGPYKIGEDGKPGDLAGYFISASDGNYLAFDASSSEEPMSVIYHEYIHDFVRNNLPDLPLWFNEGLAEYYSTFQVRDGRAEIGRIPREHVEWLGRNPLMRLDEMFAVTPDSPDYHSSEGSRTFYAQSWALVHMLMNRDEYRKHLDEWIRSVVAGDDPGEAMTAVFGMGRGEIAMALQNYVRGGSFEYVEYTFEKKLKLNKEGTKLSEVPRAELLFRLGDLLVHHDPIQVRNAEERLEGALKLDPGLADARVSIGLLKEKTGRAEEAVLEYEQALEIDPGNVRGLTLLGHNRVNLFIQRDAGSVDPKDGTPPLLLEARSLFRRALEKDPDNPETLAGYGKTFFYDQDGVEEGIRALTRASAELPSRTDILYDLIVLQVSAGKLQTAEKVLDRSLKRRNAQDLAAAAEQMIVNGYVQQANEYARKGAMDQGAALLERAIRQTGDPVLKKTLQASADEMRETDESNRQVDRYNSAVSKLNEGDLHGALKELESLLEVEDLDPSVRARVRATVDRVRKQTEYRRLEEEMSAAYRAAAGGDLEEAIAVMRKILSEDPDPTIRSAAEKAIAQWERR